jgi:hypothetical protein
MLVFQRKSSGVGLFLCNSYSANHPARRCLAAESTCGAQRGTFPTCASGTALDLDHACTVGGPAAPTDCSSDVCCKSLNTCEYVVGSRRPSFFLCDVRHCLPLFQPNGNSRGMPTS